jgi:glutamine amidotransferase
VSTVVVCDYGAGNTRSVRATLRRLGFETVLSSSPNDLYRAERVVLPGVGSARTAMEHLRSTGADDALRQRFEDGRFTLGICLGLQLALESTEEDGGVETLGLLAGQVYRLTEGRVPRLGWTTVDPWGVAFYFAHGFAATSPFTTATADGVAAVIESGPFFGVQFHPEKSGPVGERWLASCLSLA